MCAGAAAALMASIGWTWRQAPQLRRLRSMPVGIRFSAERAAPVQPRKNEAGPPVWTEPVPAADGWTYDVFTPPEVYYDAASQRFSVGPPAKRGKSEPAIGLELLAIKPEPYRLQLAGYVGVPGEYVGAFVTPNRPGSILARPGHRFAGLGLILRSLELSRAPAPGLEPGVEAVVHDEISGIDVTLESRVRKFTDSPMAVVRVSSGDPGLRELRTGDTIGSAAAAYRIERIQFDPPEVLVSQQLPGRAEPEMHVLHPSAGIDEQISLSGDRLAVGRPGAAMASVAK
ncbi:MAG TPA: hypothetical protein VL200_01475 [Lacunisphaera sp.]|nr:hypothetical protein [Lacunisphaera sp.]